METDKDQSSWNSDWAPKARRGRAFRLAGEEWTGLEKNDFHLPFLISATVTVLHPQEAAACWASETASHLWWQCRCSLCTHWRWARAGSLRVDTAHPAQERRCWGWWPCCGTQKGLHSKHKMAQLLDEFLLHARDVSHPMKWFPPAPFFWMRRLQERNFEISSLFSKSFH